MQAYTVTIHTHLHNDRGDHTAPHQVQTNSGGWIPGRVRETPSASFAESEAGSGTGSADGTSFSGAGMTRRLSQDQFAVAFEPLLSGNEDEFAVNLPQIRAQGSIEDRIQQVGS